MITRHSRAIEVDNVFASESDGTELRIAMSQAAIAENLEFNAGDRTINGASPAFACEYPITKLQYPSFNIGAPIINGAFRRSEFASQMFELDVSYIQRWSKMYREIVSELRA